MVLSGAEHAAAAVGVTVAGAGATAAPLSPRSMLTAPEMSPVPPSSLDSSHFGLGAAAGRTLLRLKRCGRRSDAPKRLERLAARWRARPDCWRWPAGGEPDILQRLC